MSAIDRLRSVRDPRRNTSIAHLIMRRYVKQAMEKMSAPPMVNPPWQSSEEWEEAPPASGRVAEEAARGDQSASAGDATSIVSRGRGHLMPVVERAGHWPTDDGDAPNNRSLVSNGDGKPMPNDGLMVSVMLAHEGVSLCQFARHDLELAGLRARLAATHGAPPRSRAPTPKDSSPTRSPACR